MRNQAVGERQSVLVPDNFRKIAVAHLTFISKYSLTTRSTLTEQHFSDLSIITMHYGERLDIDDVCQAYVQVYPRPLIKL